MGAATLASLFPGQKMDDGMTGPQDYIALSMGAVIALRPVMYCISHGGRGEKNVSLLVPCLGSMFEKKTNLGISLIAPTWKQANEYQLRKLGRSLHRPDRDPR